MPGTGTEKMNMTEMKTPITPHAAVLLDLDGVLCENTFRKEYGNEKDWALFARRCVHAAPNMDFVCMARALHLDGVAVFILTARSEELRTRTLAWLKQWQVPTDGLYMRARGDNSPDSRLKQKMLKSLERRYGLERGGGTILLAVDDEPAVVKMYAAQGIPAYLPPDVPEVLL